MEWTLFDTDDRIIVEFADRDDCLKYAMDGLGANMVMIDFKKKHLVIIRYKKYM